MATIEELEQRVRLLEAACHRFDRIDATLQEHSTKLAMLQQDVGGLRNGLTDLRASMDAKFHTATTGIETIITLLKRD
jgi:hypothetical protein